MYTNIYVYTAYRQYMSGKLYWRIKKDGKWTWTPACIVHQEWTADELTVYIDNVPGREEEE
jgi:hypothetical protein